MISLNKEQQLAYDRFIRARNRMGYNKVSKAGYVPKSEVLRTVDVAGLNHPLYEPNPLYAEYVEAFYAWLAVEPEHRKTDRMSSIRGDYGTSDSWDDSHTQMPDILSKFKGEQ